MKIQETYGEDSAEIKYDSMEILADDGRVEPVIMCEGGCKTHYGEVKKVRVIDESIDKDWGALAYCESAIAEDISRGFTVLDT